MLLDPTLIGVGGAAVIAATLAGGGRWLSWPVLRWFGQRSYALYLWHYVLVMEARQGSLPMWVAIAVSLGLAELSWRLVESPFLRRALRRRDRRRRPSQRAPHRRETWGE